MFGKAFIGVGKKVSPDKKKLIGFIERSNELIDSVGEFGKFRFGLNCMI